MRTLTFNRVIGAGAMGSVYHAELRAPGGFVRVCAVKVMKASGPDGEHFMARMRDEARLLGMLQDESSSAWPISSTSAIATPSSWTSWTGATCPTSSGSSA